MCAPQGQQRVTRHDAHPLLPTPPHPPGPSRTAHLVLTMEFTTNMTNCRPHSAATANLRQCTQCGGHFNSGHNGHSAPPVVHAHTHSQPLARGGRRGRRRRRTMAARGRRWRQACQRGSDAPMREPGLRRARQGPGNAHTHRDTHRMVIAGGAAADGGGEGHYRLPVARQRCNVWSNERPGMFSGRLPPGFQSVDTSVPETASRLLRVRTLGSAASSACMCVYT